jgi:two-component system response regulator YesN
MTDIRMPRMDGLQLTERVMELLPSSKVILLSGYTDFEYAQQAIRLGAFDYVKKPFSVEEIVNVILKAKKAIEDDQSKVLSLYDPFRISSGIYRGFG